MLLQGSRTVYPIVKRIFALPFMHIDNLSDKVIGWINEISLNGRYPLQFKCEHEPCHNGGKRRQVMILIIPIRGMKVWFFDKSEMRRLTKPHFDYSFLEE